MKIPFHRPQSDSEILKNQLKSLSKALRNNYEAETKHLIKSPDTFAETRAVHCALQNVIRTKAAIDQMLNLNGHLNRNDAISLLSEQRRILDALVNKERLDSYFRSRDVCARTMNRLFVTHNEVSNGSSEDSSDIASSLAVATVDTEAPQTLEHKTMRLTSDMLYQLYHSLFPAERMLVAGGKRRENGINVVTSFEVTGDHSLGHVKSNNELLARALIAMEHTDTYFALWVHSHPGIGKESTQPSSTDLRQHDDWLNDYSKDLVSAIMVKDRWIRFWGTAIDSRSVNIEVTGPGVMKDEEYEQVYRLIN